MGGTGEIPAEPTTKPVETTAPTAEPTTISTSDSTPIYDDIHYGDVNLDGEVTIVDVVMLNKYLLGAETLEPQQQRNANVDTTDEALTPGDSLTILKHLVDLVKELPI